MLDIELELGVELWLCKDVELWLGKDVELRLGIKFIIIIERDLEGLIKIRKIEKLYREFKDGWLGVSNM